LVARGKDELRRRVKRAFAAIPDFKYEVKDGVAVGQWAIIEWVMSGTHKRDLPGIPAQANAFRPCGDRAFSNWRRVSYVANLIIGMQLRS